MTKATSDNFVGSLLKWMRGAAVGGLLHLRIDAEPKPRNAPSTNRWGGVFYSKGYNEFYAACQQQLAAQCPAGALQGDLAVVIELVCTKPKTGKLRHPRGDVDNYAKGVLDAGTKANLWGDDTQVVHGAITKRYGGPGESPGVNLTVAQLG